MHVLPFPLGHSSFFRAQHVCRTMENAPVQWWNSKHIVVLCPYCEKTHSHGFGGGQIAYDGIQRRSDCSGQAGGGEYMVVFPFDMVRETAAYEINKREGKFVVAKLLTEPDDGASSSVASGPSNNEPARETETTDQNRPRFSEASTRRDTMEFDGVQMPIDICDVKFAILACIDGKVGRVLMYLRMFHGTDDYAIFLRGVDESGYTALGIAAMETTPDMVKLLLDYGSDVNARNHNGRTPLMEAALWGRRENVKILLKWGADKTLRDQAGKLAIDLAQRVDDNEEERDSRVKDYQESIQASRARRQIVRMLQDPVTQDDSPEDQNPRYVPHLGKIELVTPIALAPNADGHASGWNHDASLDRGRKFPVIHASSREIDGVTETVVNCQSLWQSVTKIASIIGHPLPVSSQDHDEPGQCSANHAEKQLIAYFIDKHQFLPGDVMSENEQNDLRWRGEYGYGESDDEDDEDGEDKARRVLTQLKRVEPPVCLKRATVLSTTAACLDCETFCRRVNAYFSLDLFIQSPVEDGVIPRGELHIGERIGKGSFGAIHIGKWHETEVVIKCVKIGGQSENDKQIQRDAFLKEVRVWRQADHPHIVRFLGACIDGSSGFIVSEYASGGTLPDYLHKQNAAGKSLAWRKLHEVGLGLYHFHKRGIVHSDLKGNNILVSKDGTAKLIDFGLSFERSGSRPNVKWGAIQWRPPEYVVENGAGPSFEADVYSLGMCIVEALTGGPPWGEFAMDSQVETCLRNKEMMPRPPMISEQEWGLVERMCAFEPSARMPLADVIRELDDLAKKENEALSPERPPSSISHRPRYAADSTTMPSLLS
ncbi:hypothetical protein BBJ28_00019699 [Nothophytophthora sp. Chile5]|nr:hypothetical protein BBJ28_00019699 [Nothophytophthora sp. Chile5]